MKVFQLISACAVASSLFFSCSKSSTTPPSPAETNAKLLAGTKGGSKSWALSSITDAIVGGASQTYTGTAIPSCESDNVFQFTYNSTQDYQQTEGATNCNPSTDPSKLEDGSWAFTDDGANLLIDGFYYITSSQAQSSGEALLPYFILSLNDGAPFKVVQISATGFTLSFPYTDTNTTPATNHQVTLVFVPHP